MAASGSSMAAGQVTLMLAANAGQFKQGLADAAASLDGFGDNIARRIPVLDKFVGALNKVAFGVGAAMGAIDAITLKAAADIQTPIQNVATVWDEAGQKIQGTFLGLKDVTTQIIGLSTQLPQSAASLAEGLYNVASSGFQGTDAMKVLDASARAASAGLTTTDVSGRAITAVLNAYGMSASKATDVSDTMFQVVNRGVLNFQELADNMGDIAPLASSAGVSFDEAGSALAAMTLSGLPAAEAATSLSGVMRGLLAPSDAMTAQLQALGYESGATALKQDGLIGVLNKLNKATRGQSDAWIALFPDIRAARGAMAAEAQDGKVLADVAGTITDKLGRVGSTQDALNKQSQSLSYQLQILHNTITAIAAGFGEALLPAGKLIVTVLQDVASTVSSIPQPFMQAAAVVTNLAAALVTLGAFFLGKWLSAKIFAVAIQLVTSALGEASIAARVLSGTLTAMSVITPIISGIVAGFVMVETALANSEAHAKGLVEAVNKGLGSTGNTLGDLQAAVAANQQGLDDANKAAGTWGVRSLNPIKDVKNMFVGLAGYLPFVRNRLFDATKAQDAFTDSTKTAQDRLDQYNSNVHALGIQYGLTDDQVAALAETNKVDLVQALNLAGPAFAAAVGGMNAADIAATALNKTLATIPTTFNVSSAFQQAQQAAATAAQQSSVTAKKSIEDRYAIQKDGLAKEEKAEKDSLDTQVKARKDALDAEHQTLVDAMALRHQAEQDAYDDDARTQKEALDDQQRIQKEALDKIQADIDRATDQKKRDEDRAYGDEKDRLQFLVDSTFGAEREGYKTQLTELDDSHDDKLSKIDQAGNDQKQTLKDQLDDQQQIEKDSLDGRLRTVKESLDAKEAVEKTAEDTRYANAQAALDTEVGQLQTALDDKYTRLTKHLDDAQKAEDTAADTRYSSADTQNKMSLAQYQTFLDAQTKMAETFNENLAVIANRGGADVIAEIAKLPPELVDQIAKAGPEAFQAFMESIHNALVTGKPLTFLPAGGGGTVTFRPGQQEADGGILRFADGGEYHVAQIAAAGSWRLWAEPETGGEAYIPLATSKRGRSTTILGQVADAFGYGLVAMANGGIIAGGTPSSGPTFSVNVSVENHLAPGIDMGAAGRMIEERVRAGVEAGLDGVRRQVLAKSWRSG